MREIAFRALLEAYVFHLGHQMPAGEHDAVVKAMEITQFNPAANAEFMELLSETTAYLENTCAALALGSLVAAQDA